MKSLIYKLRNAVHHYFYPNEHIGLGATTVSDVKRILQDSTVKQKKKKIPKGK